MSTENKGINQQQYSISPQYGDTLPDSFFLPDLCRTQTVVHLILIGEGLVAAVLLFEQGYSNLTWQKFALSSLYIQWIILLSLFLLCRLRSALMHFTPVIAGLMANLIMLLITCCVTIMSQWLQPFIYPTLDYAELFAKGTASVILTTTYLRYCYIQSRWRNQVEMASKAELNALQAMIRPHFIFNSINAVAELIHSDPNKAEQVLLDLSKMFRAVLQQQHCPTVPLKKELELVQSYLDIEKIRFEQRLTILWQLPESIPNIQVPALLLQPLVENAIRHGICPALGQVEITIQLQYQTSYLIRNYWQLTIRNTCDPNTVSVPGNGLALRNIEQRLYLHFGSQAHFTVKSDSSYYTVIIEIPIDSG